MKRVHIMKYSKYLGHYLNKLIEYTINIIM